MNDDINTKRTKLANQMAAAGAALLDFTGTAAALAAIPDTEPQQYVAAGTPENIAAILPATICPQRRMRHGERPTEELQWEDTPAATSGDAPDLQQLKALALAATPGEWELQLVENGGIKHLCPADPDGMSILTVVHQDETPFGAVYNDADAHFIAAANPAVVLGLIARIERAAAPIHDWRSIAIKAGACAHCGRLPSDVESCDWMECPAGGVTPAPTAYLTADRKHLIFADMVSGDLSRLIPLYESAAVSAATKPTADLDTMLAVIEKAAATVRAFGTGQMTADDAYASLLATKPAAAPAVPAGAAVDANGTTYHHIAEIYHQAEECEALHMWLDEQGVPRADAEGKVFSPVGRVMGVAQDATRFRWLNSDHDNDGVREQARSLAKRLGTSSYFAITRDIDAAMSSRCRAQGGVTNDTSSGNYAASTTGAAQTAEQVRGKSLNAKVADLLREYLGEGQKVIWREPFRWHDDNGVLSNHYDGFSIEGLALDFNYDVPHDFNFNHAAIVGRPTPTHSSEAGDA